jgi:acetyl/propionyl-CoA carboxylase alpha subunit
VIGGVKTNLALFTEILSNRDFVAGRADTGLLARMRSSPPGAGSEEPEEAVLLAAGIFQVLDSHRDGSPDSPDRSAWKLAARREALRQS